MDASNTQSYGLGQVAVEATETHGNGEIRCNSQTFDVAVDFVFAV
jgi:hypothetical protein